MRPATAAVWRTVNSFGMRILRRPAELVPDTADGLDQSTAVLDLLAQMADVHVDRAVERRRFAVVEIFHQAIAGKDTPRVAHQHLKNIELKRGEVDAAASGQYFAAPRIQRDPVHFQAAGMIR